MVCLPHARGGVSIFSIRGIKKNASSPRTWGVSNVYASCGKRNWSSPRTWGCFSASGRTTRRTGRLPHARGGVSSSTSEVHGKGLSSPRTWGCFTLGAGLSGFGIVFPTHVGGGAKQGLPPKAPSPQLGLFTSALDIDSFIWRE